VSEQQSTCILKFVLEVVKPHWFWKQPSFQ